MIQTNSPNTLNHAYHALSPLDGRYEKITKPIADYFSEFALMKYRLKIEIQYFIALCKIPLPQLAEFDISKFPDLERLIEEFTHEDAQKIKAFESITNHDVKAVEYFIKEKFDQLGLEKYKEFVHFGLTSQDINNPAYTLMLKDALENVVKVDINNLRNILAELSSAWLEIPMLARTHGQPASPTLLGKEIKVFESRLVKQITSLNNLPHSTKFGGATGNMNAHHVSYPELDWARIATDFLQKLGLVRQEFTTQIEQYDDMAAIFDNLKRINTILIDLARDFWQYIAMDYFKLRINKAETGSSAMPHKVNPIDFENAEGNFMLSNSFYEFLSQKLPISRLQRDLTDSTVMRNIGIPLGHSVVGFASLMKGLRKIEVNTFKINDDLENNWVVISEAIQTILRREGYPNPYEQLKEFSRNSEVIDSQGFESFIDSLSVPVQIKEELKRITPQSYTGKSL